MRSQTKAALAKEPYKDKYPKGKKTLTEIKWPSRSWGLGGRPITYPKKPRRWAKLYNFPELDRNGQAVVVDRETAGHTIVTIFSVQVS